MDESNTILTRLRRDILRRIIPWYQKSREYLFLGQSSQRVFPQVNGKYQFEKTTKMEYFKISSESKNDILQAGIERYNYFITNGYKTELPEKIVRFMIKNGGMDQPDDLMTTKDESYSIEKQEMEDAGESDPQYVVTSENVFGALHALVSLSQDPRITSLKDEPAYAHRGVLFDTARHFFAVDSVKRVIAAMEFNKLNVFHWHFMDSQSVSLQYELFKDKQDKLSYPGHMYTREDVAEIVEFARVRGIMVMPEVEMPDHLQVVNRAYKNVTTSCDNTHMSPQRWDGPLDVTKESTYEWIQKLVDETGDIFPHSTKIHLANDEVNTLCWTHHKEIVSWAKQRGLTTNDLQAYFVDRILKSIKAKNRWREIGLWEDPFENGSEKLTEDRNYTLYVWRTRTKFGSVEQRIQRHRKNGFKVMRNNFWYLDWENNYPSEGKEDWMKHYTVRLGADTNGGEISIWTEFIDGANYEQKLWPRGSSAAGRLWSGDSQIPAHGSGPTASYPALLEAKRLIHHFRCNMLKRGHRANPLGPAGYCADDMSSESWIVEDYQYMNPLGKPYPVEERVVEKVVERIVEKRPQTLESPLGMDFSGADMMHTILFSMFTIIGLMLMLLWKRRK